MPKQTGSVFFIVLLLAATASVFAHGISGADARFISANEGPQFMVYLYLGAKHMVTGYDHLLFLFGVIFYLTTLRSVALYVTLFALGHSITLLFGVLAGMHANMYLVDAIIGLSVVYKAFDNLGGFERLFAVTINSRAAVFVFGLFHGFGLAGKLQEMAPSGEGLLVNLLSFNLGVELGQLLALLYLLLLLSIGQRLTTGSLPGTVVNIVLMAGGFSLASYHLAHFFYV